MTSLQAQPLQWSEDKYKVLESQLQGFWAQDVWGREDCSLTKGIEWFTKNGLPLGSKYIHFNCRSSSLNTELKYAAWQKLENKEWLAKTLWRSIGNEISWIAKWINEVAPNTLSFMEKSLEYWEVSFRSYIVKNGKISLAKSKYFSPEGFKYRESEDRRISTFRSLYRTLWDAYDNRTEYEKDIWDLRKLGISVSKSTAQYTLNFTFISQQWLRKAASAYLRYCLATNTASTCRSKLYSLNQFSLFLSGFHPEFQPKSINRSLITEYLGHVASLNINVNTKRHFLMHLRNFLEVSAREGWADITKEMLIYDDDFPKKSKHLPRYIPQEIVSQLNQHLDALPVHIMRMVLVLQETGRRISEVCCMPFDCIRQDGQGDWFLLHNQFKMKKEDSIPISRELVRVIQEQQQDVINEWGKGFPYLFPVAKPQGKGQPVKALSVSTALKQLAYENNICDPSGKIYNFQVHQFRHTVGTSMINNGVPIHIVKRYLGHETFEMTGVYAHIFNSTLKKEITKFHDKIVDVTGNFVESENPELDTADLQWFKRNVQAQALPNGSCALPAISQKCPHANACLTCSHFRTTIEFLDQHKEELRQTEKIIDKAKANGWQRQVEMNEEVAQNLRNIINTLEEKS